MQFELDSSSCSVSFKNNKNIYYSKVDILEYNVSDYEWKSFNSVIQRIYNKIGQIIGISTCEYEIFYNTKISNLYRVVKKNKIIGYYSK